MRQRDRIFLSKEIPASMNVFNLFLIAAGLSMDAFAVAVCKGLALKKLSFRHMLIVGLWFGSFQGLMPLLGYLLGSSFESYITAFDHWIALILLSLIGVSMIRSALSKQEEESFDSSLSVKAMLPLALATSIDALAVGVTFAFLQVNIWTAIVFIGLITLIFSMVGVKIGHAFGVKYKSKAELAGGIILIFMGFKILAEHLELLPWL
jgi:putative Mn2+ efflux pump MntP